MSLSESINFDRIADRYDATRGGERRGRQLAADIGPLLSRDDHVLEIGVGTGVISLALREHGFETFGLDISEHMLTRARERLGRTVVRADATLLPVADATINQALSVWVLHLVADVGAVMLEIGRSLRPGGRYLVMDSRAGPEPDDAIDEIWRAFEDRLGRERFTGRLRGYTEHAAAGGLQVVDIVATGPYEFHQSAAEIADNIEARTNSWMWSIPDDDWETASRPAIEQLRSLPDPDRPTLRLDYQEILVLRR